MENYSIEDCFITINGHRFSGFNEDTGIKIYNPLIVLKVSDDGIYKVQFRAITHLGDRTVTMSLTEKGYLGLKESWDDTIIPEMSYPLDKVEII